MFLTNWDLFGPIWTPLHHFSQKWFFVPNGQSRVLQRCFGAKYQLFFFGQCPKENVFLIEAFPYFDQLSERYQPLWRANYLYVLVIVLPIGAEKHFLESSLVWEQNIESGCQSSLLFSNCELFATAPQSATGSQICTNAQTSQVHCGRAYLVHLDYLLLVVDVVI